MHEPLDYCRSGSNRGQSKNPQAAADGPSMAKAAAACGVLLLAELNPPHVAFAKCIR